MDSMLLEVLCCFGVSVAEKDIPLSFTEFKEDRWDEGGVFMSVVL
jgi:hypothetical protein